MKYWLRQALLTLLAVGCIAICISGCKSGEGQNPAPENDMTQSDTGADTTPLTDAEKDRKPLTYIDHCGTLVWKER